MAFRIKAILAASDLSESASIALRTAGALAALTEAQLHVVHSVDAVNASGIAADEDLEKARAALQSQLQDALPAGSHITSSHVAPGPAPEVILRRTREVGADLLVIGPHRRINTSGEPLGTTADRLVRTSAVPCLVVHAPISLPLRRILVPSDLSKAAEGALDVAFIWGAALRVPAIMETRLDVVYAIPTASEPATADRDAEVALRNQIASAEALTGTAGLMAVGTRLIHDENAADGILRFAKENRADLIVMGTHGQSTPAPARVGSVSSAVAQRADGPVLLVPPAFWAAWRRRNEALQKGGSL